MKGYERVMPDVEVQITDISTSFTEHDLNGQAYIPNTEYATTIPKEFDH